MPVALHAAADHRAVQHVERRKQRRRAMHYPIVGHGGTASGFERSSQLRAIKRLDLALLVVGQDNGLRRGIEVETHHVDQLVAKMWIARPLDAANPVRLEVVRAPNALHRGERDASSPRHRPAGPRRNLPLRFAAGYRHDAGLSDSAARQLALAYISQVLAVAQSTPTQAGAGDA
jgi:hypothetical protein